MAQKKIIDMLWDNKTEDAIERQFLCRHSLR